MSTHSKACCTVPPIVTSDYTLKGTFLEIGGLRTYVTGNANAKAAVLILFDIFSYSSQIQQGADIIAASGDYLVVMPDYFMGNVLDHTLYPPDTPEKWAIIKDFIQNWADFQKGIENTKVFLPALKEQYKSIESTAAVGFCWGGKVAVLMSGEDTPFKVTIQVHPGQFDAENAKGVTIPHMILASKDEPADVVAASAEALKSSKIEAVRDAAVVETYPTMRHGWMAARADLSDEENVKEYERGYKQVVNYLQEHLKVSA
ncbi:Alpha/Beta hydrolase protein [Morchella snyderi]|nr:Alpha/Beta hydrolase protein [Morchella snyderi]